MSGTESKGPGMHASSSHPMGAAGDFQVKSGHHQQRSSDNQAKTPIGQERRRNAKAVAAVDGTAAPPPPPSSVDTVAAVVAAVVAEGTDDLDQLSVDTQDLLNMKDGEFGAGKREFGEILKNIEFQTFKIMHFLGGNPPTLLV